jgi:hypothetical protein
MPMPVLRVRTALVVFVEGRLAVLVLCPAGCLHDAHVLYRLNAAEGYFAQAALE